MSLKADRLHTVTLLWPRSCVDLPSNPLFYAFYAKRHVGLALALQLPISWLQKGNATNVSARSWGVVHPSASAEY